MTTAAPTMRSLHLGAGRQSTAICLLIAEGRLPKPDYALFSDTGAEVDAVYPHLDRIERELLKPAGVPLRIVNHGKLDDDVLSSHVFATIPAYTLELIPKQRGFLAWDEPIRGRLPRHCTGRYKIEPLQREERILMGARIRQVACKYCEATGVRTAPWNEKAFAKLLEEDPQLAEIGVEWLRPGPCSVCRGTGSRTLVDRVPDGALAEVWVGFDATEAATRINDNTFASYQQPHYPLLDLERPAERVDADRKALRRHREVGWTMGDCLWYLNKCGYGDTPKSACYMCPNANNPRWRYIKKNHPADWKRAVAYDKALRDTPGMRAQRFLHEDRVPLDQVDLSKQTAAELRRAQGDLFNLLAGDDEIDPEDFGGCSPHSCQTAVYDGTPDPAVAA